MPHVNLHFLGSPRIEIDGQPLALTSAKAIAVLGYLVASDSPVKRERLLDLLWADSAPEAARKNLRNTLWSIRKALGEESVAGDDQQLGLAPSIWSDVRVLKRAAGAHDSSEPSDLEFSPDLYQGPFLDGLELDDAPDFEIWLTAEREQLSQMILRLLSAAVERFEVQGLWQNVIETAARALELDNLQEPMYRAQMIAYARMGARVDALRQYDALCHVLERELGVEPLAETISIRDAILRGDYDQRAPQQPSTPRRSRPATAVKRAKAPFVGRQEERKALDADFALVRAGHAHGVVISGEMGIGKSRLWEEWSRSLPTNVLVLEARCLESTQALPFASVVELLQKEATAHRLFDVGSPLARIWLAELSRLFPEIALHFPKIPAASSGLPPDEERRRIFEALAQAFLVLLSEPVVMFFDDLQWIDTSTLDWLDYAIHRLGDEPLYIVTALRPEDAPAAVAQLLARWAREGVARRFALARLTEEESTALAAALHVDPTIATRVQLQSAGNPYFLIELVRALPSQDVPHVLVELVRARLERLPDVARQVLQAAAVLEPDFDFSTLRRTSGRDEEETLDAIDILVSGGWLSEMGAGYVFSHPLVSQIMRESLGPARRSVMHQRAASALETTFAHRLAPVAGRIAAHYAQAGDESRAAHFAEMAAEHAITLAAPAEAIAFYRQAIDAEPTSHRYLGLGKAMLHQGDLLDARRAFETALDDFQRDGDRKNASAVALLIAETLFSSGRFDEGNRWIEKGIEFSGGTSDPEWHAMAHLLRGVGEIDRGQVVAAEKDLSSAARHATESNLVDIGGRAYFVLGNALAEQGDLTAALDAFRESLRFAEKSADEFQQALSLNNLAYHSMLAGDLAAAHGFIEKGLSLAEQRALRVPLQNLYSTRGEIALAEKAWTEAEDWFERGMAEAERNGNAREIANYRANLGLAAQGRGDLDGALVALEGARAAAGKLNDVHLQIKIDLSLAELYLQRGEKAAGKQALARADERLKGNRRRLLQEWADRLRPRVQRQSRS